MQCPLCGYEPPLDELFLAPCPACKHVLLDTSQYVEKVCGPLHIESVLDVGCGNKGVIGESYWHKVGAKIYMCDIHVLKPSPPHYVQILDDAVNLKKHLGYVDFVTHCGFLEHLDYAHALEALRVFEEVALEGCFATASCIMRDADAKAKADGNPYHRYRSFWDPTTMRALGYIVDDDAMEAGLTFSQELPWWWYKETLRRGDPWEERVSRAVALLCSRRCYVSGCELEPVVYLPRRRACACLLHHSSNLLGNETTPLRDPGYGEGTVFERWLARPDAEEVFGRPPWRAPRRLLPG